MNRSELIQKVSDDAGLTKGQAARALVGLTTAITRHLKSGGTVIVQGLGTFYVGIRSARTGRNPLTGAAVQVDAIKLAKFRPGKALKDELKE